MLGGFDQMEKEVTYKNVQRTLNEISHDISHLNHQVGVEAVRHETYSIINPSADNTKRDILDTTFIETRINLILYINSSGAIVLGKGFDLQNRTEIPIPDNFQDISANSLLLKHPDKNSSIKGILLLPEGPMLIVSRPIPDTESNKQIRGSLIWGRYINSAEIERLAELSQSAIIMYRIDDKLIPADFQEVRDSLSKENPIIVRPLGELSIAGYTIVRDIYGYPALLLRVDGPRDIYNQSRVVVRYLFLSLLIVGLIIGGMSMWQLERLVLSRLARLNENVSSIGKSGDVSKRVEVEGNDELSNLSGSINRTLEALEKSDIERMKMEEELIKHRDRLEEIVEDRTAELKNSEEKYRSLVESTEDSIYMVTRNCNYLFINTKHKERLGMGEYPGQRYSDYHSEEETKRFTESVNHVFGTGEPEHSEYESGGRWFSQTLSPVINTKDNTVSAVTVVSTEITARKRAEEIRIENEGLVVASKAKSDFLTNMSHELRTPLNAIIGFSELLMQKISGELNKKQEHYVNNVLTSSKFLLTLINQILDLSKVEAGKIELDIAKMPVQETIDETILLLKEKAAKNNIVLKKEFDPQLDFIEADRLRFKQVLFNLLSNAIKFSKKEGGTVTITTKKEGQTAKFSISDTGIGIKEEDLEKLFKEFEQLDKGISRKYGGTGLGLAITKNLVELHGGKIVVESKYDKGSTFTVLMPSVAKKEDENDL